VIDANVILRGLLLDSKELSGMAMGILKAVEEGRVAVCCDPVTLAEVVWVLWRCYSRSRQDIASALEPIVRAECFHMTEKDRYLRALELYGTTVEHFGDACVCAAALEECEGRLYSFDRKLSSVPGVKRAEHVGADTGQD
jgi:predicted nucleic-acid-binding protein